MKIAYYTPCIIILFLLRTIHLHSQKSERFAFGIEGTFSHFEQQVKSNIGGESGDKLSDNSELGLLFTGTYSIG